MILLKSVYGARLTLRKLFADELTEWLLEAGFIYKSGFEFCGTQVSKVFIELAMFSSNPGKVHFEGSVHIFRYIDIKIPWLKATQKEIKNLINNQNFIV